MPTKLKNETIRGRPPKLNKEEYGQVTCVLRWDTIDRLKAGAASKHFGEFLQAHLDRYPPPTREQFVAMMNENTTYYTMVKRKRVPTLIGHSLSKQAKKMAKERARREKMSPEARAWQDRIAETVTKTVKDAYAGNSTGETN